MDKTLEDRVEHLELTLAPMALQVAEIHRALFMGQDQERGGLLVRVAQLERSTSRLWSFVWAAVGTLATSVIGAVAWLAVKVVS